MRSLLPNGKIKVSEKISPSLSRSRPPVTIACESCRTRKVKCDGNRPNCSSCVDKHLQCKWRTLERPTQITRRLQHLSNSDALSLFDEIRRSGDNLDAHQGHMSVSPLLLEKQFVKSCLPATLNGLEFELAVRHPVAYPTLFPIQAASYKSVLECQRFRESSSSLGGVATIEEPDTPLYELVVPVETPALDESLRSIHVNYWTNVSLSNESAARILSLYFRIDYPSLPIFHKELFLDDLKSHRTFFCSRLLVSALLSWACQAYTAFDKQAASLSTKFFLEAENVLNEQRHLNTLTTVSALQLLSMTAVTHGRDDIAQRYLRQGVKLGQWMGLFNARSSADSATAWLDGYPEWIVAASYTAWGVFNWISIYGLHYQTVELLIPPGLPKPGSEKNKPQQSDRTTITNDLHSQVFGCCCDLWSAFHIVLVQYHSKKDETSTGDLSSRFSLAFAEENYRHLLSWAGRLPLSLVRNIYSDHSVMMMHIYFHAVIIEVFRPFLFNGYDSSTLSSFETASASPKAVCAASKNQLKRLVLLYRADFPEATLSVLWQTGLIGLANAVMADSDLVTLEWKFYLRLALAALQDLSLSFRVFGTVTKGLLGMALQRGAMSVIEAKRITTMLQSAEDFLVATEQMSEGKMAVNWIIDAELALSDPIAAQGGSLADHFQRLVAIESDTL